MFNGYNDTPLISYNEFDQPREKKQENVPKWSYGHATGVQSHAEFWSAKPNFLGITTPINPSSKCNCSGCYSENSSYQGDSTRHRPWLPRRFPVPLNGSSESCKLQGNHQWDNIGFSNQESCLIGSNVLTPQFLQENGGKRSYYRHYQNTRLPDLHQHGVITSIKTSSSSEGHVLLNQKNEISPNSTGQEMAFFGQNGARQTVFCNPPYDLTRNLEKRLDNRNSDPNFSDLNEKYSNLETYRHASGITQYPVEHHFSRSPVVEPYMKAVPLNLNQNRVPSTGHRNYKENITQSYIEQSIMRPNNNGPRKMIGSEVRQPVSGEKNGRVIFQSGVMKDGTVSENFQSGQLHSLPSPVSAGMDKKNNEILIDYAHFNMNRDLSKHYENITEMETQKKILFDCERHVDYFSRNSMPDTIKRSGQTILQDNKKDCALNQAGQTNYSEQQFNNCSKLNQGSNVPKYLEMNNSKPSVAVFYPKEFSADKISKPEKCGDHIQENPGFTQRNENFLKNENLSVRACLTRPPLIFNDPRDLRFVDKAQNSFPYQNNSCRNFVRPEYPCQSYSVPNSYDHSHSFSTNGFQRNNPSDINHRNLPQKISNCSSADLPYVSSANSTFICDPYCEQSGNLNKTLPQQFYTGTEQVSTNAVEMYSHVPQCRSEKLGPENSSELKKSSYLETISSQDISKNGNTKISPLRLLRKKKFVNQQSEIISKSPVPTNNSEVTPTLDVRKFWSTWADEEEDNTPPTQMVVLDCQNIDPEQAKLLHLYENDPANSDIHLENGGLLAVKDSGCADKDLITSSNHYGVNINEVKLNPEQIGLANKINRNDHIDSKVSTNANQFKAVQRIETVESGTLEEKKLQVSPLNALVEIINKNEKTEPANVKTEIVETGNLEKLNEAHYAQNISKDFNKANMFEESKEIASDKIEAGKKTELGESEKWADKKINIAKDGEQREATKIPRSEGTEIIHKTRPSFQTENVSNGKAKKNNSKNLEKATVTKPKLTQLENEANCDDTSNSLSPFDYSSQSASPYNAKIDFPTLPTSEYRRNKFLDYSDKRVIVNGNLAFSLEADNVIKARENDDLPEKVVESAVSLKNDSLPVSEVEEIKEKNIKQECPYKNSRSLLDKCLTSELSKSKHELFKSESVINDFESKEETGLQNFEIDDILQKMSNINFQCSEHKIENGFANHVNTDHVKAAKTPSALKKIKKSKKLEHRQGADRTDKPLIENISEPKPMMKFSIQKSDDLKISFKVLNDGSICKKEKFESNDEEFRTRTTENGRIPVTEPKNETVSKTLKIKSAHNNDWTYIKTNSDDVLHRSEKEVLRKKNKRRFRRKKIKESKFLQKKTPLLKIKKSRYLVPEEKKFLSESASYKKDLNLLEEQTDVYFASTDFQVRESVNSAKIKLTFKRQKSNFENEYKISDYGIENAKANNIESDDQLDFNNADYQSEGDESRSSRKKHRRSLNENSLSDLGTEPIKMENEFRPLYVASDSEDFSKNDESNFGRDPPVALSSAEFYKNQSQNADIKERIEVMYSDRPSAAKLTFSSFNTNLSERKPENLKEKTLNVEDEKLNSGKTIEKKFDDCEKEENEFEVSETFISEVFKSESTDDVKFIEAKVISKEGNVKLIVNEFVNCNDNSRMNDKFYKSSLGSDSETQKEEETLQEFSSDELDVKDPLNDTPFEESEESEKNFKDFEEECKKIDKNTNLETTANNILKENKKSPKTDEDFSVYITSDLHKDVNEKTSFDQSTGVDNCELNVLKINDKDCVNIEQLLNGEADDKIVDLVTFEKCDWLNCSKKEVNNFNNNDIFDSKFDKELNFEKSISPVFTPNVSSLEKIENKEALKETDGQEKKIKNELVGSLMCDESSAKVITSEGNAVMSEDDLFDCVEVLGVTEKNSGEGFTSITESRFINTFTDDAHFEKNKNSPLNSNSFENKNVEEEEENEESTNAKDPKIDEISKALEAIFHENEDDKEKQCRKKPENAVDAKKVDKDVLLSTVTQIPDKNAKPTSNDCKDLCDNRNDILHLKSNSNALNETSATTKETTEISQAKNQKENDDINKSELNQSNKLIISSNESSDDAKKSFSILENDNDKTDLIDSFPIDKDLLNSSDKTNMKNELCLETTDKSDILLQSATATDSIKLADPLPSSQIEKKNVTEVSLEKSEDHCPKISKNKCTNEPKEMRESSINTSANIKKSFCEKQTSRINNFKKSIFDQSKTVERRHSLNESEVSGFVKYQGDNYSTKYISKIKFTYSKWKTRYFKSKSCPPFIKSSSKNELQIEMPILDIPVEEIPLPSGCPPPENCFDLSELKKRKLSNENQNDSKYVQPSNDIEKPKTQLSLEALPLYELSKCEINKNEESEKVFQQNNNKCISKRGKPRNVNSIENCHSPFMLCDFRNCRNPSPPPTGENEKDSMPAASTTNEKISSLSPSDVCCGLTLIKENAQHSENANNTKKLKMTIVEERKTSTETNDLCSESITDICVESRVSELVGAKINYEDSHVKDDNLQKIKNDTDFNFPDFLSHKESKLRTQVTKLNFIEEKQLTDSNNDDKLKEITTNENEFLSNLCSFEGTDSARNSKDVEVRLMDENMDLDENEANDSEKVDFVDDESTTGTGFENDELMRGGFYECEDIPTSEDLPNGNDIEVEKVSDDDKFRHMMQNCLDNAKKFLNVNNLKLFSCSMEDLLELDCQLTDATLEEKEPEKSVDSTNHISRDVLLTSCEKVIGDDLELSENFPPSNLTVDFTPSFESESSNNLCPEILPVDNWPYLEEEVPSSPTKADLEEADLIPFLESSTNQSLLNRSILHTKSESKNGVRSDFCKVINKKKIKRFRRRSLMADDETSLAKSSKISGRRRKTMDALVGNHLSHQKGSGKDINSLKAEITRLKSGLEKIEHLWQNNKDLKCRLSLDRLETSDSLENKYKIRVLPCVRDECKIRCTCKKEEKTLKHNIQNLKNSKINDSYNQVSCNNKNSLEKISSGGRNHPNYKSPIWQPKVMLFRISKKELRKIQEQSYSISRSEIKDEKRSCQSLKQGKGVISQDMESDEFITKKAKVSYNFENDKFDRNSVTDNSQIYVKHFDDSKNCFVQIKGEDKKFEKNVSDKWDENTCEKFSKTELYFCRLARAEKLENRSHRENSTSTKSLFEKSKTDQNLSNIDKEGFITVSPKGPDLIKRKKSRFRNLHSKKRIKSNLSAKDITSSSHNILPKKPTLVDTERVLNEIFKECDQSKEQVLTPRTSGNEFIRNTENKGMDVNVKNKSADVSSILDVPYKKVKSHTENVCHPHDEYCSGLNSKSLNNHSMRERNESSRSEKRREKTHNTVTSRSSDFSVKHRRRELSDSYRHNKTSKKFSSETYRGGHENNEKFRQESEYRERKSCHKHKEKHSAENDGRKEFSNRGKRDSSSDHDISSEKKINNPEKSHRVARSKSSSSEDGFGVREASSERPWMCEVCGFNNASERITHIKDHPFHCQSCHLAFRTEARFINHLTRKHKDIRNQHHCLLCELSFDTEGQYQRHLETREHKHLETVEKNTINTLFTLLTGQPCPVLGLVEMKPEWLPNQAGTVHFYHQATPLSLALQYLKMHHDLSSYSKDPSSHSN